MATTSLPPALLAVISERFKALSEAARLRLLNALRDGERTVTELMEETGMGQANVSKHLHVLYVNGLVARRRAGSFVHYAIADERVFRLCDLMCDQLRDEFGEKQRVVTDRGVSAEVRNRPFMARSHSVS